MRVEANFQPVARIVLAALPKIAEAAEAATHEPIAPTAILRHAAPATPSVDMLMMIAATDPVADRRLRDAKRLGRGIDGLAGLHRELLSGAPSVARLREMADWARTNEMPDDPALAQLFTDIDIRVRVELAKLNLEV